MREYRERTVQEVAACTCDRCGRRMTPVDDQLEWYEKMSPDWRGGFCPVFQDGTHVSLDLCQQCVRDTLGPWLRVDSPSAPDGSIQTLKGAVPRPDALVSVEQMNPWDFHERD